MCGRFTNKFFWHELHRLLELTTLAVHLPIRYNIAPTQTAPIVRSDDRPGAGPRSLAFVRWGLVPSWAKDIKVGSSLINARAEGIESKPSFRSAFKRRRCLVPVSGFYEWKRLADGKGKQPFYITSSDEQPMVFAGLWESWSPPSDIGDPVETFTIITTTPNKLMATLHDRMPVILDRADFAAWLDPAYQDTAALLGLLKPCLPELMKCHPVSTRVNSPRVDEPSCIERADETPPRPPEADVPEGETGLWG